jgi:hypothetical protein
VLVDLGKKTQFRYSTGKRASLSDISLDDTVEVEGLLNTRLQEITTTTRVTLVQAPNEKGTPVPTTGHNR